MMVDNPSSASGYLRSVVVAAAVFGLPLVITVYSWPVIQERPALVLLGVALMAGAAIYVGRLGARRFLGEDSPEQRDYSLPEQRDYSLHEQRDYSLRLDQIELAHKYLHISQPQRHTTTSVRSFWAGFVAFSGIGAMFALISVWSAVSVTTLDHRGIQQLSRPDAAAALDRDASHGSRQLSGDGGNVGDAGIYALGIEPVDPFIKRAVQDTVAEVRRTPGCAAERTVSWSTGGVERWQVFATCHGRTRKTALFLASEATLAGIRYDSRADIAPIIADHENISWRQRTGDLTPRRGPYDAGPDELALRNLIAVVYAIVEDGRLSLGSDRVEGRRRLTSRD